LLYE